MKQIHEEALVKFERIESKTDIPKQKIWEKPVSIKLKMYLYLCMYKIKLKSAHPKVELQKLEYNRITL